MRTDAVLLRLRRGRDALLPQALTLVCSKLFPTPKPTPAFPLLPSLALDFIAPFVSEVATPSQLADEMMLPDSRARWAAAVAKQSALCGGLTSPDEVSTARRHNCVAVVIQALANSGSLDDDAFASVASYAVGLVMKCGLDAWDVLDFNWQAYTRQRLGVEEGNGMRTEIDSSDDDDAPPKPRKGPERLRWSLEGVAVFAYAVLGPLRAAHPVSLLPSVMQPLTWLRTVMFSIPILMKSAPPTALAVPLDAYAPSPTAPPSAPSAELLQSVHYRAVVLLASACAGVRPGSNFITDVELEARAPEYALSIEVISFMVGCPSKELRTFALRTYEAYLATFSLHARCVYLFFVPVLFPQQSSRGCVCVRAPQVLVAAQRGSWLSV